MKILGNVIKSQSDKRLYQAVRLHNQIDCLIISDWKARKSAAAMSVGVGSLQDPLEAQGLAHYLEHMLFMGTEKYPNENDYSNFIAKNFGMSNAYTSQQETNYHFQVSSPAFEETLSRFAQFFICPIMSDSSSERQLNAVHSEHSKNIQNDMWRKFQLTKHLAKDGHPFKKFSTGDKNSLSNPNLRELLHNFYKSTYSSNLMKLVVYGNKGIDQMAKLVEKQFSGVPNKCYSKFKMLDIPYDPESFGKIYKIVPIKDKKILELTWLLPDQSQFYENSPGAYLSYVIGHEGNGSLLSLLISEGLAVGLSCGHHDAYNCFSEFQIQVSLTDLGLKNIDKIMQHIFYFIELLKSKKPEEWIFRQIQETNRMRFNFQSEMKGMSFVSGIAKKLQDHSTQEVLAYPYFMKEWRPQLIQNYLSFLTQQRVMAFLQAKELQEDCNLEEPIYKTKYGIQKLQNIQPLKCNVQLPQPNPYIPQDFTIADFGAAEIPSQFHTSERSKLFFKKDHRFGLPKIILNMKLYFGGSTSARESVIRQIYSEMLNEELRQFTYYGEMASIGSSVSFDSHYTFDIEVGGFRDSVSKFTPELLSRVFSYNPDDQKYFSTVKEKLKRQYSNYHLSDPFRLAYTSMIFCLHDGLNVTTRDKEEEIDSITMADIKQFGVDWKRKINLQAFLIGNIEQKEGEQILTDIDEYIGLKSQALKRNQIDEIRGVRLPPHRTWLIEERLKSKEEENSCVIVHFQHEAQSIRNKVLHELCVNFVKQPAFDYLRTKEQLGYIVMCMPGDSRGVLGISILVQSAIKTSYQLSNYIDTFLQEILNEKIKQLDEETFASFKASLENILREEDKNLLAQSARLWHHITHHTYHFTPHHKIKHLQEITLQQFNSFMQLLFYMNPKRIEVHQTSHLQQQKNARLRKERLERDASLQIVADMKTFKKKMDLYPDFYGHL